jgi:hypothetical protein
MTPAGWQNDPWFPGQLRYWDGAQWTWHTAPVRLDPNPGLLRGRWAKKRRTEFKASGALVDATYSMLFADKAMVALMFVGGVLASAAGFAVLGPPVLWGDVTPSFSGGGVVGALVAGAALGAFTFVLQLTTGTVVAAAALRAEGTPPTVRRALGVAWSRRRQILAWAAVSTFVGVAIRGLERLGIGGVIGALTLNIGWAAATVFSMPVVIIEGTMPLQTLRRSSRVLKDNLGATVFGGLRLALPWTVALWTTMAMAAVGVGLIAFGGVTEIVVGSVLVTAGVCGAGFCVVVSSSLTAYLQTNVYRYATGRDVPGVDPGLLPPLAPS